MHKFVILLAICLVTVNAFVKRETQEEPKGDDLMKQFQDLAGTIGAKIQETFNPDKIKQAIENGQNELKKLIEPKETQPKA